MKTYRLLAREYGEEACAMVWDMSRCRPHHWLAWLNATYHMARMAAHYGRLAIEEREAEREIARLEGAAEDGQARWAETGTPGRR